MKKKVIATSAVLGLAALILGGGTLAYFTDQKWLKTTLQSVM